jgi:SAM-dependent methyltransferase
MCGQSNATTLFIGQDLAYGTPGLYPVRQCRVCDALYLSPRPVAGEMEQHYIEDYAPHALPRRAEGRQRRGLVRATAKLVRAVEKRAPGPGRALDVGCGSGEFLSALERKGWQVDGVEISPRAAAEAQARLHGRVHQGELAQAGYASATFDVITFWDVLEHLHAPRPAVREAARISKAGALLVVTVPNVRSLEARLFGFHWAGWDIPRHLWWAGPERLRSLLEANGWRVEGFACLRGRHWLFLLSLRLWLEARPLPQEVRRAILAVVGSWPVKALLWPYFALAEALKVGSILGVFARREDTIID